MQYRLRNLTQGKNQILKGLTVPENICAFFEGCYFNVEKSGTSITFYSGCNIYPTKKEIDKYDFSGVRV